MTDCLGRLLWAVPLVIATGAAAILLLKRIVVPVGVTRETAGRMHVTECMTVAEGVKVHLLEVDGQAYLLVESAGQPVLQALRDVRQGAGRAEGSPAGTGVLWALRLFRPASR